MHKKLLIIAHQPSTNTQQMASAFIAGSRAAEAENVSISMVAPLECQPKQLLDADAVLIFTTENLGYMVVEPEAVIATHLNQILSKQAADLLGQDDVQALLDNLSKTSPQLVSSTVPKLVPLNILTSILKLLLIENMPISDLKRILEVLASLNVKTMSPIELAEAIRPTVSSLLIQQIAPLNNALPIITFSAELEQMIVNIAKQTGANGLILEGSLIQKIVSGINSVMEKMQTENRKAVMITAPVIRRDLSQMLRQHIPTLDILSFTELPDNKKIEVVANIGSDEESNN